MQGARHPAGPDNRGNRATPIGAGETHTVSAHRILPVLAADNPTALGDGQRIRLVCEEDLGEVRMQNVLIRAKYFPSAYASLGVTPVP